MLALPIFGNVQTTLVSRVVFRVVLRCSFHVAELVARCIRVMCNLHVRAYGSSDSKSWPPVIFCWIAQSISFAFVRDLTMHAARKIIGNFARSSVKSNITKGKPPPRMSPEEKRMAREMALDRILSPTRTASRRIWVATFPLSRGCWRRRLLQRQLVVRRL